MTSQRVAVLKVLRAKGHPLSPQEIHGELKTAACDLATVYRSLRLLEEMGMVRRYDFGDRIARYELLSEGDDGHHHHLVCTCCHGIVELDECFGEDLEKRIVAKSGFKSVTHKLEFFGVCPACQ